MTSKMRTPFVHKRHIWDYQVVMHRSGPLRGSKDLKQSKNVGPLSYFLGGLGACFYHRYTRIGKDATCPVYYCIIDITGEAHFS